MKKPDLKFKIPSFDLKLPSPGGKRPSAPKTSIKPPQFVAHLYADLRDRRLLPLVALLLVAIVAAPFLLAGKGEDEEAAITLAPNPSQGAEAAEAASFAVVPAQPGLRDYRKRLGHREARNPFAQPKVGAGGEGEGGGEAGGSSSGGGEVEAEVESGSGGSSSGEGGTTVTKTTTTTDVVVESKITGYELKARAGFLGDIKEHDGVAAMTTLPSEKNPVVIYLGPSKDKKSAIFLMTSNVTAFYGKAKCVLDQTTCTTVELKPGQSATFAYGYGETRFKLTLQKLVPVVKTNEQAASVTKKTDGKKPEEERKD
jgi:hypothetical protein